MASSSTIALLLLFSSAAALFHLSSATIITATGDANSEFKQLLADYGLPRGIFPDIIANFTFDTSDNSFSLETSTYCYGYIGQFIMFDMGGVDSVITGKLEKGNLYDLSGVFVAFTPYMPMFFGNVKKVSSTWGGTDFFTVEVDRRTMRQTTVVSGELLDSSIKCLSYIFERRAAKLNST